MSGAAQGRSLIEKTMALTEAEFAKSLDVLMGPLTVSETTCVRRPLGSGAVEIGFEPLECVLLGGLLELPRAKVTLLFDNVPEAQRTQFLRRFDVAFQRGGG